MLRGVKGAERSRAEQSGATLKPRNLRLSGRPGAQQYTSVVMRSSTLYAGILQRPILYGGADNSRGTVRNDDIPTLEEVLWEVGSEES
jgi:hypothetical protein